MSWDAIRDALEGPVVAYATGAGIEVVPENVKAPRTHDGTHLRLHMLPAPTVPSTMGATGYDERKGIFQITVKTHLGLGTKAGADIVDALVAAYRRQILTSAGTTVETRAAWPGTGQPDGDFYAVPVSVSFYSQG